MRLVPFIMLLAALTLSACAPGADAATPTPPIVAVKQLVTVESPPTLSQEQRAATQQALPRSPTPLPPTPTPTATPYIGVFIERGAQQPLDLPQINDPFSDELRAADDPDVDESDCEIAIDAAFGTAWRADPSVARQMACPIQARFGFSGAVQVFERGVMYRRDATNEVWAVSPGRIDPGSYWYADSFQNLTTEGLPVPEGLRAPEGVFGAVWLENNALNVALGFATTPEQLADLNVQRFDGGTLLLDVTVGQVFVLLVDGTAYGPYSA